MKWKYPHPIPAVQMIPYDAEGRILCMHRSASLRSARNVWSFPSGLHDIGETANTTVNRELLEEYGLQALEVYPLAFYENIAGDPEPGVEQYHWMITLFAVRVADVTLAINKEPEKHDIMDCDKTLNDLLDVVTFTKEKKFHKSFENFLLQNGAQLVDKIIQRLDLYKSFLRNNGDKP